MGKPTYYRFTFGLAGMDRSGPQMQSVTDAIRVGPRMLKTINIPGVWTVGLAVQCPNHHTTADANSKQLNSLTIYNLTSLPLYYLRFTKIDSGMRLKTSRTSIFFCSKTNRNQSTPKDVTYIFSSRKTENVAYDTSFLRRTKLIIDGDVESNPGPVSSVESHRAAIGRHNGKFKLREKVNRLNGKHFTLCLVKMMLVFILFYALFVGMIITCRTYIPYFLALLTINCYSLSIFCVCSDLFCIQVERTLKKDKLMRKSITDRTLISCRNVDTYVIDGRNRQSQYKTKFSIENGNVCWVVNEVNSIDSKKIRKLLINITSYVKQFLRICFWFFLCFNVLELNNSFQAKNKTLGNGENVLNSLEESYSVSFLKLSQLLLAGDVESNPGPVNYTETPKGKGRPKKSSRASNFGKPKVLDFTSVVSDNRFLKQANLIHLSNWIVSEIYYH